MLFTSRPLSLSAHKSKTCSLPVTTNAYLRLRAFSELRNGASVSNRSAGGEFIDANGSGRRRAASKAGRRKIRAMKRLILGPSKPTDLTKGPLVTT